ncbi:MAG TPA: DUF2799 domain-containing protein [Povalibacter sp.]|jgi:hypothetical protein|nr:DUF2799 domain-containing protein [Povalibacter sp.]
MRSFHAAMLIGAVMMLMGCSSMSEKECLATDWRTVGYEDGVAGRSGDRIGRYREQCSEHGVAPSLSEYQAGREQGLREFCKPVNGFRVGARGAAYNGVCPADTDDAFLDAYQSGRQLYALRSRVNSTANAIRSAQAEIERLDQDLITIGAQIIDSSTSTERRAQLVVDSKHMAERRGELRARIPAMQNDLAAYQRELDDYSASLPYVE